MKILFDAQIFLNQKAGGISRYYYELLKGMKTLGEKVYISGKFVKNQYLLADKTYCKHFFYHPTASFALFNKWMIRRTVSKGGYDIFHPSDAYSFIEKNIPVEKNLVFTVHDMIREKYFNEKSPVKQAFAQRADKIIAVSETTKNDIVEIFGIEKQKIEVVYHGSSFHPETTLRRPAGLPQNYILQVGERGGYKNFDMALRAIVPLLDKHADLYMVCAGRRPFSKSEQSLLKSLNIDKKVFIHTQVDDNTLASLYSHAAVFIFPSLYEGFGIPILESWTCGAPVVLSNNSCFREIAGDAALYFDPCDKDSITATVEEVLMHPTLQNNLRNKGSKRLSQFSWERAVQQTNDIYKSLIR
jgi:glycosyltransferase involved in cell wall biosynthesis